MDTNFKDKEIGDVGMIEERTEDNNSFKIFVYEISRLCDEDNGGLDDTWWVRGRKDKQIFHRQQWDEEDGAVHIPEAIWVSF